VAPTFADTRIYVPDKEQDAALSYARIHLGDLVRSLHRTYYAAFEGDPMERAA
jgi:hypothetical protein